MPDPGGITPPYLDPSQYPEYLDMQRKQMLAQMLMGNVQQANQTPANWDSMKVVPRRGMLSSLSSIGGALLAGKALKGAQQSQQQYFQGLYGGGAPSSAAPPSAPQEPTSEPPPLLKRPEQPAETPPEQPAPAGNPLIPSGMAPGTAAAVMSLMGPAEYGKTFIAPNYKPAEIRAQIRAAGIDPDSPQGKQLALRALNKATTTLEPVRPGTGLWDFSQNKFAAYNPSVPQGAMPTFQGGTPTGIQGLPGGIEAAGALKGAETAAEVTNKPGTFPTQGGGQAVGYPGDVLGPPPAMRQPGAPAPAPKGYFPAPQTTSAPTSGPWASMPKLPVSKSLGAPDEFTKGRLQEAGKKDAELSSQYGKEADLADQKLQYNVEALKALPAAETGPLSEWMTENRAKLLELGIPESVVPGSGKVTPTMELNKNLKQSALQGARAIFGSRMTQMEVRLQHEELSPSTSMTRDAIQSLMQQDTIKQQYAKQRAQDYGKYVQQGGDPLRFESWYSHTFPLTTFAAKAVTPQSALDRLKAKPELLKDFKAKYGWDPSAE